MGQGGKQPAGISPAAQLKTLGRLLSKKSKHNMDDSPIMPPESLIEILDRLEGSDIDVWLDGGWGVDALLEKQTRVHQDVDIIIRVTDVPRARDLLEGKGFILKEGKPPHSFVLADDSGLEVDIHAVRFDKDGNGIYRMQNGEDWIYPAEGFTGRDPMSKISLIDVDSDRDPLLWTRLGHSP
jgi:lincosamide nucleotidyltransferase A/C/D/E